MCDRWRESFAIFLADMGAKPAGTSLERIDNEKGYEPGNCRWATPKEQGQNTRLTIRVRVGDSEVSLKEFARLNGQRYLTVYNRMKRHNLTPHEALKPRR